MKVYMVLKMIFLQTIYRTYKKKLNKIYITKSPMTSAKDLNITSHYFLWIPCMAQTANTLRPLLDL